MALVLEQASMFVYPAAAMMSRILDVCLSPAGFGTFSQLNIIKSRIKQGGKLWNSTCYSSLSWHNGFWYICRSSEQGSLLSLVAPLRAYPEPLHDTVLVCVPAQWSFASWKTAILGCSNR